MNPNRKKLPVICREIDYVRPEPFTKEGIKKQFNFAEREVLKKLLSYILKRDTSEEDIDLIELVEGIPDIIPGNNVYYCDVKIGCMEYGYPKDIIEIILDQRMPDFYVRFKPDEEFKSGVQIELDV